MNYLAHAYLSFHNPDILMGNMISDFVKGKKQYDYPLLIRKGIRLHREIDGFTDRHPATLAGKQFFKPLVGLYAGAFMDVVYDHFLALDEHELTGEGWKLFAAEVYEQLAQYQSLLPEHFVRMLPYMSGENWLYHYRFTWGIEKSFQGVAKRARYLDDAAGTGVFKLFDLHYAVLKQHYDAFFPDVKKFARLQLTLLLNQ